MKELNKAFDLINEYKDHEDTFFIGERSEELVQSAERALGFKFPNTFRAFVCLYGAGNILGQEFYGITTDNFVNSSIPNAIWLTLQERINYELPNNFILIHLTGDGFYYAVDCSKRNESGECPIVEWNPNISKADENLRIVAIDFGVFLLHSIKNQL